MPKGICYRKENSIWYWRVCSSWLQCAAHHRYHSAPLIPCLFPRDEYSRTNEILSHSFNLYCWDLSPPYPTYLSLKSVGVFSSHRWYLIPLLGKAREIAQKLQVITDIVQQERALSVEYVQCLQNTVTGHKSQNDRDRFRNSNSFLKWSSSPISYLLTCLHLKERSQMLHLKSWLDIRPISDIGFKTKMTQEICNFWPLKANHMVLWGQK